MKGFGRHIIVPITSSHPAVSSANRSKLPLGFGLFQILVQFLSPLFLSHQSHHQHLTMLLSLHLTLRTYKMKCGFFFWFFFSTDTTYSRLATGCDNFAKVCLSLYEKLVWINLQRSNVFGSLVLHIRTGQMKEIIWLCVQYFCLYSVSSHCSLAFMITTKKKSLRCFWQWSSNRWLGLYCQSVFFFFFTSLPRGLFLIIPKYF